MLKNTYQKNSKISINANLNLFSKIVFTSTSKSSLLKYLDLLDIYFQKLNLKYFCLHLPVSKKRIVLLKSPHVNKKAKEHFEINVYKAQVNLKFVDCFLFQSLVAKKPKSIQIKFISGQNK